MEWTFLWKPGRSSSLPVLSFPCLHLLRGGQQRPRDVQFPPPCLGVLQGIHDRAASSLQLPHLAHTLTALAIIFTEGLTANKSLLGSGPKIWFPGSAGRKTAAPEHTPSTSDVSASENFHLLPSTEVVKDICILCLVKMMTELIKMQLRHFQLLSLSLSQIFS